MSADAANAAGLAQTAARPVLAIVGATGAVGTVMRAIVSERARHLGRGPAGRLRPVGWPQAGRCAVEDVVVQELTPEVFDGVDLAMFDVPDEVSAQWAPVAAARGVVVIDKSGAFRMDPQVPLVVPEVNPEPRRTGREGIISVPNCTTLVDDRRAGRAASRVWLARAGGGFLSGGFGRGPGRHRRALRPAGRGRRATGPSASGPVTSALRSATAGRSAPRWR